MDDLHVGRASVRGWVARVVALLVSVVLASCGLVGVNVARAVETSGDGSITVDYEHDGVPVAGVKVDLYRVATWSDQWQAQPTEDFEDYQVVLPDLTAMSQNKLRDLANTLASYAQRDDGKVKPLDSGVTGTDGEYTFSDLPNGLYLLVYGSYSNGNLSCDAGALLVSLPTSTDKDNTSEGINVTVEPKTGCETVPPTPPEKDIEIKVVKVWDDNDDSEHKRPSKVVVQLLRDGKVYDEVVLNEANNWTHVWTGLDPDHEWSVVEKTVPDGYTVSIDRDGGTVAIVNTLVPPVTPPGENPPSENPPSENPPSKTPPFSPPTGAEVAGMAAAAVGLAGVGAVMLLARRRKRAGEQ